jgi:hypothetical protein
MEDSGRCLFPSAGVACGGALSHDLPDRSIASAEHACALCDGLFDSDVLRPELLEERSSESAQLL